MDPKTALEHQIARYRAMTGEERLLMVRLIMSWQATVLATVAGLPLVALPTLDT